MRFLTIFCLTEDAKKTSRNEESPPTKKAKKLRAVVDLESMKEELKQLSDPPASKWEREISSNRLPFEFFDVPCEELAQKLLGRILQKNYKSQWF